MRRHIATSAAVLSTALGTFGAIAGTALAAGPTPAATDHSAANAAPATTTTTAAAPATTTTTAAAAATTTSAKPTTTTTTPSKTTTPTPTPVKASTRLYLPDAFVVHGNAVTVPNRPLHVGGSSVPTSRASGWTSRPTSAAR